VFLDIETPAHSLRGGARALRIGLVDALKMRQSGTDVSDPRRAYMMS